MTMICTGGDTASSSAAAGGIDKDRGLLRSPSLSSSSPSNSGGGRGQDKEEV